MGKVFKEKSDKKSELVELLKEGTPRTFEREPAPAFSQAELEKLSERIIELLS